jgi:vancomycin resistance protein VanJ
MPRGWRRRLLLALCLGYPLLLGVIVTSLATVGERFWLTAAALYLPRLAFAIPLPVLVVLAWYCGLRRLLWAQLIAAALLVPLTGFVLPWPSAAGTSAQHLRVLSFNVDSSHAGVARVVSAIVQERPDVVLIQESLFGDGALAKALGSEYAYVQFATQFTVASRYRIESASELEPIPFFGHRKPARSMRYVIETPFGEVAFYSVHPASPRGGFHIYRFHGALEQLGKGDLFSKDQEAGVDGNATHRTLQIEEVARKANAERLPVVIAGDTNLPGLSPALRTSLSGYEDGFVETSWGFGYTFPAKWPFMRLDRMFVGAGLRFDQFHIGCAGASDHLCVWADLSVVPH